MSPGRFGWLFKSLHNLYGRHHDHSLSIMNIHGERRLGRRRRKACRLWTGDGPQRAYRGRGGGILCRHAHSLFIDGVQFCSKFAFLSLCKKAQLRQP